MAESHPGFHLMTDKCEYFFICLWSIVSPLSEVGIKVSCPFFYQVVCHFLDF